MTDLNKLTVVMYHFVRYLKNSRYPHIKGLDISDFHEQINYFKKHYQFITIEMLIDSIDNNVQLPPRAILLTFDDAYSDHFEYVFPFLDKHKIQGAFYPPVRSITENSVLDVNKIHFILAGEPDTSKILLEIKMELDELKKEFNLERYSYYYDKLAKSSRLDTAEVIFIKRLLQIELDEPIRNKIVNNLFEKIVKMDEASFSRELYMNIEQIQCMYRNGMHIGNHGYDHYWLGSLNKNKQRVEIEKSLLFLKEIGIDTQNWTMCYPYGNYNDSTLELLSEYNCKLAFTTRVDVANICSKTKYILPRLDTNDFPKNSLSCTNEWLIKANV